MSSGRHEVRPWRLHGDDGWGVYDKYREDFVGGWFGRNIRIAAEQMCVVHERDWLAAENERLRTEAEAHRAMYDGVVNEVLENTPEHYDGDEGGGQIAVRYVRDLERVADLAQTVAKRLACLHDFDPECGRCEWLTPFRGALRILRGEWPEEEPATVAIDLDEHDRVCTYPFGQSAWRYRRCVGCGEAVDTFGGNV